MSTHYLESKKLNSQKKPPWLRFRLQTFLALFALATVTLVLAAKVFNSPSDVRAKLASINVTFKDSDFEPQNSYEISGKRAKKIFDVMIECTTPQYIETAQLSFIDIRAYDQNGSCFATFPVVAQENSNAGFAFANLVSLIEEVVSEADSIPFSQVKSCPNRFQRRIKQ